jgi:SPP1 family predicted phage head-tail adaptor
MPGAGEKHELLQFQKRVAAADDGYGNRETAFAMQFLAKGRVRPLKGSEQVIAARLTGVQPVIITIRSCAAARAVTAGWRVENDRTGVIYNIRSLANFDEKNREIDFLAETGVPT